MNFTDEQIAIFEYAVKGPFNMIVEAVAGAGKTTTLVECVKRMPRDKRIFLLAHNKSTRDELKNRINKKPEGEEVPDFDNVTILTLHGLGWRLFKEHFDETPTINENKYRNYINRNINEIASDIYTSLSRAKKMLYRANVFDILDKARQNLKQSEKEIRKLGERKYGINFVADEPHFIAKIIKWGAENRTEIDYQDLLYFPHYFGYFTKQYLADVVMLDEAQDASIAQLDVISRCTKRNTRLFAFGDKDQMINNWCGATDEAFEMISDENLFRRPAVKLPLTVNHRCGKKIIEYAKQFVNNDIKPEDDAEDGIVRHDVSFSEIIEGDMVLCRNTYPLMDVYRKCVAAGKRVYFRGEGLGETLVQEADSVDCDTIAEVISNLKRRLIATWDFITVSEGIDEKESMVNPRVVSILDTIRTMESLPRTVETKKDLAKFAQDMFSNEGRDGIQLSTIHRAKGLEADNVFIICPSLVPSRLATLDWELKEEQNLQYVMCTRAKHSLNFVSEKELAPHRAFTELNSLYKTLNDIRDELSQIQWND